MMYGQFLEEQLERIREMTEQMARLRISAAELSEAVERDRAVARYGPLHEIRDFRIATSVPVTPQRDRADDHAGSQHSRPSRTRRK